MRKAISMILVCVFLLFTGNVYAEVKNGANITIEKIYSGNVEGELIAVKENSLLLLLSYSSVDVSIRIDEIKSLTIEGKPKTALGALLGFLTGGSIGASLAGTSKGWGGGTLRAMAISGILYGILGGFIGGGIGGSITGKKTIIFEGRSDSEIQIILENLRKKARVKNPK
jgi:hypothetical protein